MKTWTIAAAVAACLGSAVLPAAEDAPRYIDPATGEELAPLEREPKTREAARDRVEAAARYSRARLLEQDEEYSAALAQYARAWRLHPQPTVVLDDIVRLGFELGRGEMAARYAVISAERNPRDPDLLRSLARHVAAQADSADLEESRRKWRRAAALYELAADVDEREEKSSAAVLTRFEMGRIYFLLDDFKRAAASFAFVREALDDPEKFGLDEAVKQAILDDDPQRTWTLLAESFLRGGRHDDAEQMFRRADKAEPNEPRLAFQLARVESARGDTNAALKRLETFLAAGTDTEGTEPYELLEELLLKQSGDKERAEGQLLGRLEKLFAANRKNVPLGYTYGRKLAENERLADAERVYRAVLEDEPAGEVYQGLLDVYRRQEDAAALLDLLGEAILHAGTLAPLGEPAVAIAADEKLVDKLVELAEGRREAGELGGGRPLAMSLVLLAAGRFDAADEYFSLALKQPEPPPEQLVFTWGLESLFAGHHEAAIEYLRASIKKSALPNNPAALHFYLAGALEMDGRTDEALRSARRAIALAPDDMDYRTRPAWILYHAARYEDSRDEYQKFIARHEDDFSTPGIRDAAREAKLAVSAVCVHLEDIDTAVEWLEQVLDEFPEDVGAHNDLGYLWADEGVNLSRAVAMTTYAVEAEPENVAYRDSLGWAFFRMGRLEEARRQLERAIELSENEPDGVILDHLGDIYFNLGRREQALAAWRRALDVYDRERESRFYEATMRKVESNGR